MFRYFLWIKRSNALHARFLQTRWPSKTNKGKDKAVPLQAWTGPEVSRKLRLPDFVTTAQDGGKFVSLTHRPPLPPRNTPGTHFCLEAESTPGPKCDRKDFMSMKNPLTLDGIESATFRFVSQHLNHCATAVPSKNNISNNKISQTYYNGIFLFRMRIFNFFGY